MHHLAKRVIPMGYHRREFLRAGLAGVAGLACGYPQLSRGSESTAAAQSIGPQETAALNPFTGVVGPKNLLILAPDSFIEALQPLVQHKTLTNMPAVAVPLSRITAYFTGVDDPEKIKRAIQYASENLSTRYVMLVGDAANFPVRFWFLHDSGYVPTYPKTTQPIPCQPSGTFIQSDLYYANLYHHTNTPNHSATFDTWDADGNGLYNEAWMSNTPAVTPQALNTALNPDDVDGYPDVAVGRVPARNVNDVAVYVKKIIAYESTRAQNATATFTFVHDQLYGALHLSTDMANAAGLPHSNAAVKYLLIENEGNAAPSPFSNATSPQVAQQAGVSTWLSYVGHGSAQILGRHGSVRWKDLAPTKTLPALPVVFAAGCQTSLFSINTPWGNETSVDVNGVTRGPFIVARDAKPDASGLVMTDQSTGQKWGLNTSGCNPLPVPTPFPSPINVANACWANPWLFDYAPGGAIAYIGDHCVAPDSYPARIETSLLRAYVSSSNPILGRLYLTAQQQYWAGPDSKDAANPHSSDYHGIPRLYLGWLVFFGDPSLRLPPLNSRLAQRVGDFDGDGLAEILVSSPREIAILKLAGASMTPLLIAPNGTSFGGWSLKISDTRFGPVADYDGDGHDEILVADSTGIAILKLSGGNLTTVAQAAYGTAIGDWTLTALDQFGPVGDYDKDGAREILVYNTTGIGILKLSGTKLAALTVQPSGASLGAWKLDTSHDRFGPAADYDGDGAAEILVTSPAGIGILKLSGKTFTTPATQANGTQIGAWPLDTFNNQFGPVADFDGDGTAEIVVTGPAGLAVLKLSGETFAAPIIQANGTDLGAWPLDIADNQFGPAADYDGDGAAEILVTSPAGIGILKLTESFMEIPPAQNGTSPAILKLPGKTFTAPIVKLNGTRFDGWVLDTAANRFGSVGGYVSGKVADIFVTSNWGIAILRPSGNTFAAAMIRPNGSRLGAWRLETTSNVF
jgi:hypothetical protein